MGLTRNPFHILLLIMLPVLCVPRGMLLDYCFCQGVEAGCCGEPEIDTCCDAAPRGASDAPSEDGEAGPSVVAADDCSCCETFEVTDFEDSVLRSSDGKVDAVAMAFVTPRPDRVVSASAGRGVPPRAPPQVIPPGLRPGTLPLRL